MFRLSGKMKYAIFKRQQIYLYKLLPRSERTDRNILHHNSDSMLSEILSYLHNISHNAEEITEETAANGQN